MKKKYLLITIGLLCSLYGCASLQPIAVASCPQAAPKSPEMLAPAPPPGAFGLCLREILAVGQGTQVQISVSCSKLLLIVQTK